jgi:hypothetical protein
MVTVQIISLGAAILLKLLLIFIAVFVIGEWIVDTIKKKIKNGHIHN